MWTVISNPIVSHLLAALVGAAGAWYATHRSMLATAGVAIEAAFTSAKSAVGAATVAIKKDV
jgi:hypothetical protein